MHLIIIKFKIQGGLIRNFGQYCRSDKYTEDLKTYWPDGLEQLTNIGKQNMHRVGQVMRTKYDKFLGNNSRDIFIQSLDHDRCLESGSVSKIKSV